MGDHGTGGETRAADALESAQTVPELLRASCVALVEQLDASACAISRVLGDVLVALNEYAPAGENLQLGQGYLVTDFPLTNEVIKLGESRAVSLLDDDPDPQESALLEELGFDSLLMVPMPVNGQCWALVEVYARGGVTFPPERVTLAEGLVARTGALVEQLL